MDTAVPSTRRDTRFRLEPGSTVAFAVRDGISASGDLVAVSIPGLAFQLDAEHGALSPGTSFEQLTIRIGQCIVEGKGVVRNVLRTQSGRVEVGCLFYPCCDDEDRWMSLLTGIGAAPAHGRDGR